MRLSQEQKCISCERGETLLAGADADASGRHSPAHSDTAHWPIKSVRMRHAVTYAPASNLVNTTVALPYTHRAYVD